MEITIQRLETEVYKKIYTKVKTVILKQLKSALMILFRKDKFSEQFRNFNKMAYAENF